MGKLMQKLAHPDIIIMEDGLLRLRTTAPHKLVITNQDKTGNPLEDTPVSEDWSTVLERHLRSVLWAYPVSSGSPQRLIVLSSDASSHPADAPLAPPDLEPPPSPNLSPWRLREAVLRRSGAASTSDSAGIPPPGLGKLPLCGTPHLLHLKFWTLWPRTGVPPGWPATIWEVVTASVATLLSLFSLQPHY
ncbi:hypothetical protein Q8A73_020685 [Channa argus]|nr:hypothetical protein Q8A73_020685 [Channa argus]